MMQVSFGLAGGGGILLLALIIAYTRVNPDSRPYKTIADPKHAYRSVPTSEWFSYDILYFPSPISSQAYESFPTENVGSCTLLYLLKQCKSELGDGGISRGREVEKRGVTCALLKQTTNIFIKLLL